MRDLLLRAATDGKNVIIFCCIVYLFIIALKLLFSNGTEEDIKHWRHGVIWTVVAIVLLQSSYGIVGVLYNLDVGTQGQASGVEVLEGIVYHFIDLLQILVAFIFIAMMIYAFFKIVTAQGDEEKVKRGKREIFYLLFGFVGVKIADIVVATTYGTVDTNCVGSDSLFVSSNCVLQQADVSSSIVIMTTIVNWLDGFIAILVVLAIIWAGFLILTSVGHEDRLKRAYHILLYTAIGLILLVVSLILFNFLIYHGVTQ